MTDLDLARFRILVAVAKADGTLAPEEEEALQGALGKHSDVLPELLAEEVDIDVEIAKLSESERKEVFHSAYAMAYADGHAQTFEVTLLKKLQPNHGEDTVLGQVWGEALDTVMFSRIMPEPDPVQRDTEIMEDTFKYAALSAVAGMTPVPGVAIVADLAVVAMQAKLVHDIGLYWGHNLDSKAIQGFLGSAMGSIGLRIAVNNLARFVPGWGMAFAGATSFASTYAVGRVANMWFAKGQSVPDGDLSDLFKTATEEGRARYAERGDDVVKAKEAHGDELASLNAALASGEMDRATYDVKVAMLGS